MDKVKLLKKSSDCPSEHTLDLFVLGELDEKKRRACAAHLKACSICAEKARRASLGFDAHPTFDAASVVDGLHRTFAGQKTPPWVEAALDTRPSGSAEKRSFRRGTLRWAGALMTGFAAAALMISLHVREDVGESVETVRAKGGAKLEVFRNRSGKVLETVTGDSFQDGDHLRFKVNLPFEGYVLLVGVEQGERIYPCFPIGGNAEKLDASRDFVLPDAVRLDDSKGEEWLHLILCKESFDISDVHVGDEPGTLFLPEGCATDSFKMNKVSRE